MPIPLHVMRLRGLVRCRSEIGRSGASLEEAAADGLDKRMEDNLGASDNNC